MIPTKTNIHPALLGPIIVICLCVIGFQAVDLWHDHTSGIADVYRQHGVDTAIMSKEPVHYANLMQYQKVRLGLTIALSLILWQLHSWYRRPATPFG